MGSRSLRTALTPEQFRAVCVVINRVLCELDAELVQASLFGSRARGEARPDSDVDILLVFEWLPPDREPYATQAETIAEEVATASRVPVTVWSVSLVDLDVGNRTPMLVDALEDSIALWCEGQPIPALPFTRADALRCGEALLDRVAEGSVEFRRAIDLHDDVAAARRGRDDLVRLATALLLFRGQTRPRRAQTCSGVTSLDIPLSPPTRRLLHWVRDCFGPDGRDPDAHIPLPPGGLVALARAVEELHHVVRIDGSRLMQGDAERTHPPGRPGAPLLHFAAAD
jgi:predicted nucleotidyltransferase